MLNVIKILQVCASKKFNRTLNGSKPGMGKTLEVFMAAGATALAFLSQDHYLKDRDLHNSKINATSGTRMAFNATALREVSPGNSANGFGVPLSSF